MSVRGCKLIPRLFPTHYKPGLRFKPFPEGLVVLLDMLDGTVKDLATLKRAGMVIVGVIPPIPDEQAARAGRRQDILLYSFTGIYCIGIASVVTLELLGAWK